MTRHLVAGAALALLGCLGSAPVSAEIGKPVIRIGILNDRSGPYADLGGPGSVVAAQLAIEDAGGKVNGAAIELVSADHQNKPDIGSGIARRWLDQDGVDVIADVPVSSVALAVQEIGRQAKRITLMQATTSDLSGKACSPYSTAWQDDTYSFSKATAQAVVATGSKRWFFISADYAFGHALERDAGKFIKEAGGTVTGAVRHPINAGDMSSYLVQAQSSKADVVAFANGGADLINSIKQADEFGVTAGGQKLVGFLLYLTDVHALGLPVTKGLLLSEGFYWNQNEAARTWSKRFFEKTKRMPTKQHASVYASVAHYLKAVKAADTLDADAVAAQMRTMPVDYFGHSGTVRQDGRVVYPMTLYEVKSPAESKEPWDYLKPVREITAAEAFRPISEGGCGLVK
ncbi:ABC transporter substrate-binding protein [Azospirillum sp. RWY-5-1]|uniref:ABC transporter substrate-binding protein n=1 Tax=Azospirillum oleiclasticum TaxID=2735135 RepID=A0ABX2THN8_9PROT|nr:ABC transporter substrate-binding protein [Azospirillum oleiclasticum]NYZ14388.1 ABC transporter substrate-binding protein [Azospirillum oleiclasticum]NYZ23260.1 ABC transporter substrate-binding protein [Azospirillum oleiclasticum]